MKKLITSLLLFILVAACSGRSPEWSRTRSIMLKSPNGQCSGVQVRAPSGHDYILTAAHCRALEIAGSIYVTTEDGKSSYQKIIAEDANSDLLLLEGVPNLPGVVIARGYFKGEQVKTYTHGSGMPTYETEGVLIGTKIIQVMLDPILSAQDEAKCSSMPKYKVQNLSQYNLKACILDHEEMYTTALIVPGSSGGMVLNYAGDLVGIVSATDGHFGALVTLTDIQAFTKPF